MCQSASQTCDFDAVGTFSQWGGGHPSPLGKCSRLCLGCGEGDTPAPHPTPSAPSASRSYPPHSEILPTLLLRRHSERIHTQCVINTSECIVCFVYVASGVIINNDRIQ